MNSTPRTQVTTLIEGLSTEELADRLADVQAEAARIPPILDDDDLEQAIEDAADRIVSQRRNRS